MNGQRIIGTLGTQLLKVTLKTRFYLVGNIECGHSFTHSPKGFPLEGEGIKPHYLVPMKVNDFLLGKDTQLSYAEELTHKSDKPFKMNLLAIMK